MHDLLLTAQDLDNLFKHIICLILALLRHCGKGKGDMVSGHIRTCARTSTAPTKEEAARVTSSEGRNHYHRSLDYSDKVYTVCIKFVYIYIYTCVCAVH